MATQSFIFSALAAAGFVQVVVKQRHMQYEEEEKSFQVSLRFHCYISQILLIDSSSFALLR